MSAVTEKIIKELNEGEQYSLADTISDVEEELGEKGVLNYLAANSGYFNKIYTHDDLALMPTFNKAIQSQLKTGKVDYDKEFGEDWYRDFENIPLNKIRFVAEEQGVNWKDLNKAMAEETTRRRRYDIAHGNWDPNASTASNVLNEVGGTLMTIFTPRRQEAIALGREPGARETIGDIGENLLYMTPYTQGARAIAGTGRVANVLATRGGRAGLAAAEFAAAPIATEAYDAATYDTGDETGRGDFSALDVGAGTVTNILGNALLRRLLSQTQRATGAGVKDVVMGMGEGSTAKDIVIQRKMMLDEAMARSVDPSLSFEQREEARKLVKMIEGDADIYFALQQEGFPIGEIAAEDGANILEKTEKWLSKKGHNPKDVFVTPEGKVQPREAPMTEPGFEGVPSMANQFVEPRSPVSAGLMSNYEKLFGGSTEGLSTRGQLLTEAAFRNYATNRYGSLQQEQGKALTRLPGGTFIQSVLDNREKRELEEAERKKIIDDLMMRGLILGGDK